MNMPSALVLAFISLGFIYLCCGLGKSKGILLEICGQREKSKTVSGGVVRSFLKQSSEVFEVSCQLSVNPLKSERRRAGRLGDLFLKIIVGASVLGWFPALLWGHLEVKLPVIEAGSQQDCLPVGLDC